MSRHGVACHLNEAGTGGQDETFDQEPLSFLSLPAEIRNTIYHELLTWHHSEHGDNCLHEQPAITRVNRQLRAEALPLYYASSIVLRVKAESPEGWIQIIQRIGDAFTGGPVASPGSSTMRLLGGIHLDFFVTQDRYHVEFDLAADPDNLKGPATSYPCGKITYGSTSLNWADATALRAACDEAIVRLGYNLMENIIGPERFRMRPFPLLDRFGQRPALDALCAFASACPHLTHALVRVNVPYKRKEPTASRSYEFLSDEED